jgi:hypothetical protein
MAMLLGWGTRCFSVVNDVVKVVIMVDVVNNDDERVYY